MSWSLLRRSRGLDTPLLLPTRVWNALARVRHSLAQLGGVPGGMSPPASRYVSPYRRTLRPAVTKPRKPSLVCSRQSGPVLCAQWPPAPIDSRNMLAARHLPLAYSLSQNPWPSRTFASTFVVTGSHVFGRTHDRIIRAIVPPDGPSHEGVSRPTTGRGNTRASPALRHRRAVHRIEIAKPVGKTVHALRASPAARCRLRKFVHIPGSMPRPTRPQGIAPAGVPSCLAAGVAESDGGHQAGSIGHTRWGATAARAALMSSGRPYIHVAVSGMMLIFSSSLSLPSPASWTTFPAPRTWHLPVSFCQAPLVRPCGRQDTCGSRNKDKRPRPEQSSFSCGRARTGAPHAAPLSADGSGSCIVGRSTCPSSEPDPTNAHPPLFSSFCRTFHVTGHKLGDGTRHRDATQFRHRVGPVRLHGLAPNA